MNHTLVETDRLRIVSLDLPTVIAALEDRAQFEVAIAAEADPEWPLPDMRDLLGLMRVQMGRDSSSSHWGGVIVLKTPALVVGDVGFHSSPVDGQVELGYSVVPGYRNRGVATEAAIAFLNWSLQYPNIGHVIARTETSNNASSKVLIKAGFKFESEADGYRRYGLSRSPRNMHR